MPKALLARHAGTTVFSGISTRIREDPANAIELTERIVAALIQRGLPARAASRENTRELCTRTLIEPRRSRTSCTFPDDVGLLILVGYPTLREPLVVRITVVADSRLRGDDPVISMDVSVENMNGTWRVVSIRRAQGASE